MSWPEASRDAVSCPICNQAVDRCIPAQISPFLVERCHLPIDADAKSNFCDNCEHAFFTPFLSEKQTDLLYEGYRNNEYDENRLIFEPDYIHITRQFRDIDSDYFNIRRNFYDQVLSNFFGFRGLVVDFGGGDGYFGRYMFPKADVVNVNREPQKAGIDMPSLLADADMLVCSRLLQAVASPLQLFSSVTRCLRSGTRVWVELPTEYTGSLRASFEIQEFRHQMGQSSFNSINTFHENQHHFSGRSAKLLMSKCDLALEETIYTTIGISALLARKN